MSQPLDINKQSVPETLVPWRTTAADDNGRADALDEIQTRTEYALIRAHVHASVVTVLLSALFGLTVSLKFFSLFSGEAWSTWGRLRYNHTEGIFFGWLGNAFLAFAYYVVPRLTKRPVSSRKLGWTLFALWNFAVVLPGWTLVLLGHSQPLEWAEFPLLVAVFVVIAFALALWQFALPFFKLGLSDIYVSGWYLIGGLIFTFLAYPVGNLVPYLIPGAMGAAFSGLWIHDAVGLFVTPLALVIAYWVIPATTGRPIWSHFLSMLGFWLLFFIYPLNGTHHYVYSAIPMSAQKGAILASVYLGMDVVLVVANLLLSLRGATGMVGRDIPLRYVWTGVILYLVVSLQGSMQAIMPVNRFVHFTDWVIGHSHLAMIGFASMIAAGGIAHAWQRIPGTRYNERLMGWSYWLVLIGLALMVLDLTMAGVVQGQLWDNGEPWIASVRASRPYWEFRSATGVLIIVGFLLFWAGLVTGPVGRKAICPTDADFEEAEVNDDLPTTASVKWLGSAYAVSSVAGLGFFLLSFVVLGIVPAHELQAEMRRTAPHSNRPLTASEQRGRLIYGRDGCAYCHTEQVRTTLADIARFGAPTAAWETQYDYPQLWGTRRIGPDLAREAGVRSDDWQLTHLFNPRLVARDSVMPSYSYLFNGSASQPSQEALDLLAYLKTLGNSAELAGRNKDTIVLEASTMAGMAGPDMHAQSGTAPLNGNRAIPMTGEADASAPVFHASEMRGEAVSEAQHGSELFAANCASCHGVSADGKSEANQSLLPKAANLLGSRYTDERLSAVLWNGIYGSAMPAWREYSERDLRDLTVFLQHLPRASDTLARPDEASLKQAQGLFLENCAPCHGEEGDGHGPAAAALAPDPTNFHIRQPTCETALNVLAHGVPGTAMPEWTKLSLADRQLLATYIRSLFGAPVPPARSREQQLASESEASQ